MYRRKITAVFAVLCLAALLCGCGGKLKTYDNKIKALENESMGIAALGEATFPLINQSEDVLNGSSAWTYDGEKYVHEITLFSNASEAQAGIADGKINAVLYVFGAEPSDEDMIALYEAAVDAYGAPQGAYIDLVWSDAQQASEALYGLSFSEMLFVWQHQDYEISVYLCRDGAFRSMYVCFSNPSN